ncbi:hypothetical protein O6H91_23G043400 [Diphasiastrum complanatum]|uniref:Uncharacterized protein n=1 Tax=Diphasiastrum complanatum TaxID=34168 RepID=A0ACC2AA97_DIPCM|nr:hypothetical protein O6H91_23G043400 [Diphasiastrum complanatum]
MGGAVGGLGKCRIPAGGLARRGVGAGSVEGEEKEEGEEEEEEAGTETEAGTQASTACVSAVSATQAGACVADGERVRLGGAMGQDSDSEQVQRAGQHVAGAAGRAGWQRTGGRLAADRWQGWLDRWQRERERQRERETDRERVMDQERMAADRWQGWK